MLFFIKKHKITILALLFLLSILPFLNFTSSSVSTKPVIKKELFYPELQKFNSVEKVIKHIDSIYLQSHLATFDTAEYVKIASRFTKERFYHGLSHYNLSDNWIAALSGKLCWFHLSAIVNPNDILKHAEGLCSQQTIVFMEVLKQKDIKVRSVGLGYKEGPGHFLSEVHYNGNWHLHDVTMEPNWEKLDHHHGSLEFYLQNKDSLYLAYDTKYDRALFNKLLEKVVYGKPNEFPAKNMLLFHKITFALTCVIPFILLSLLLLAIFGKKQKSQQFSPPKKASTKKSEVLEHLS